MKIVDLSGINESSLVIYHYHNNSWTALSGCVVDTNANTVTCTTTNFSTFALVGASNVSSSPAVAGGPVPLWLLEAQNKKVPVAEIICTTGQVYSTLNGLPCTTFKPKTEIKFTKI